MRLYTVETENRRTPAVMCADGKLHAVNDFGFDFPDMNTLVRSISADEFAKLKTAKDDPAKYGSKPVAENAKILSPIPNPDSDIICLGVNYMAHREEFKKQETMKSDVYTVYFGKKCSEAVPDGGIIPAYTGYVEELDYEAELGVILGRDAKGVKAADAGKYIFGYTVINDVTARDLQKKHTQWYLGKGLDGFTPMGPCIVTADEFDSIYDFAIKCYVNGELRQNSVLKNMIRNVEATIEDVSYGVTLKAGTIISTGTPAGVGMGMTPQTWLKPGDVVVCEIENIGTLTNTVGE